MKIPIVKFGEILVSRPAGREASLIVLQSFQPESESEKIELDFDRVLVMAPSWLDEVIGALKDRYGADRVVALPSKNPSVTESLKYCR